MYILVRIFIFFKLNNVIETREILRNESKAWMISSNFSRTSNRVEPIFNFQISELRLVLFQYNNIINNNNNNNLKGAY
jgi:hypothetical protein